MSPIVALTNTTPFEAFYSEKPSVAHFRVFGCDAYVHVPGEHRTKLDMKSNKMIFLGYTMESKAYKVFDSRTGKAVVSRDVVFDEMPTSAEGAGELVFPLPISSSPPPPPSFSYPLKPLPTPAPDTTDEDLSSTPSPTLESTV